MSATVSLGGVKIGVNDRLVLEALGAGSWPACHYPWFLAADRQVELQNLFLPNRGKGVRQSSRSQ